jgi:hypothetical protein
MSYLNATIQEQRSHESLKAVGHGMPQFQVMAQVRTMSIQHVFLQAQNLKTEKPQNF